MEEKLRQIKKKMRKWLRRSRILWLRFSKEEYVKGIVAVLAFILVVSFTTGYSMGNHHAMKNAKVVKGKMAAQHKKETDQLQKKLKEAQIKNPEVRPWYLTLVNNTHPMEEGYVPKLAEVNSENSVDERILEPLKQMLKDAEKAGMSMYVCSGYRSVERQKELYNLYMGQAVREGKSYWDALVETQSGTAYPGRSEHGMGLAVDIISNRYTNLDEKQQETPEAKWLMANCYKYGFILRYPVNKTEITGIKYEPWHYRYVGKEDAEKITKQGITLEEYLGEVD